MDLRDRSSSNRMGFWKRSACNRGVLGIGIEDGRILADGLAKTRVLLWPWEAMRRLVSVHSN
jgi:hypothetical protein